MPKDQSVSGIPERRALAFREAGELLRTLLRTAVGDERATHDQILERFQLHESRQLQAISDDTLQRWLSGKHRPRGKNWEALKRFLVGSGPIARSKGGAKEAIAALDFLYRLGEMRKAGNPLPSPDEAPELARAGLEAAQQQARMGDLADKAKIAGAYLEHVFPRRLGRQELRRDQQGPDRAGGKPRPSHEGLRESARAAVSRYETVEILGGDELLGRLLSRSPDRDGFALVLGEPGGGKTTLLQSWHAQRLQAATGREPDSVYVRLGKLGQSTVSEHDLAARLLASARLESVAGIKGPPVPDGPSLWLLDGLDETDATAFAADLAALPGRVVVSCRTAVWEGLSSEVKRQVDPSARWEIQHLKPEEQVAYLAELDRRPVHRLWPRAKAEDLVKRIGTNIQMREIAGSPLLLDLIGEVGQELELPASRADLFELGFQRYWNRRLPEVSSGAPTARVKPLTGLRDRILQDLANRMLDEENPSTAWALGVSQKVLQETIEAQAGVVDLVSWVEAFRVSGILSLNDDNDRVGFAHLAFQEYTLARHWLATLGFEKALTDHWADLRAEETLGLMVGLAAEKDAAAVDRTLIDFSASWLERHQKEPEELWGFGRSPARVVYHLLGRSGVQLGRFPAWFGWLSRFMSESALVRLALASDERSPAEFLGRLASDADEDVQYAVARNPSSPAAVLATFTRDARVRLLCGVARNTGAPAEILAQLAGDADGTIRAAVAMNTDAPADILVRLAGDTDFHVRKAVAWNPATPAENLAKFAGDADQGASGTVDDNSPAATALLTSYSAEIAASFEHFWQFWSAMDPQTPAEVLARLAGHDDEDTRSAAAGNAATPAPVLARLAGDDEMSVRRAAAENTATLLEDLFHR